MGKSVTPKYRVEATLTLGRPCVMSWDVSRHGRPSVANLERWREGINTSFQPGGTNGHLSKDRIERVFNCQIVNQFTGEVVAEYKAPAFEVV